MSEETKVKCPFIDDCADVDTEKCCSCKYNKCNRRKSYYEPVEPIRPDTPWYPDCPHSPWYPYNPWPITVPTITWTIPGVSPPIYKEKEG